VTATNSVFHERSKITASEPVRKPTTYSWGIVRNPAT